METVSLDARPEAGSSRQATVIPRSSSRIGSGAEALTTEADLYSFVDEPTYPLYQQEPADPTIFDLTELPTVPRELYAFGPEIARGGMGRILTARDRRLGRPVAIKELSVRNALTAARFEREARITGRLQHPAIVPVYEAGRWPNGEPFYAMKLVAGESLDKVVDKTTNLRERLAILPKLVAVAEALAYAHSHHIVHRDLKPANVLIGEFGEIVVIDWGLAKDLSSAQDKEIEASDSALLKSMPRIEQSDLTMAGAALGTPAYMPPEQALGEPVDQRADVYALGAMLYHLLAGKIAYHTAKSPREVITRVIKGPPEPLGETAPEVPPDLVAIVQKAMARAPEERYPSAKELAEDLKRFTTGQLVSVHDYSLGMLVRRWLDRHRSTVRTAALMMILLVLTATVGVWRIAQARNEAEAQRQVAEEAQARAEARSNALVLVNARTSLEADPTMAVAWLRDLPVNPGYESTVRLLALEARARGVAQHVLRGHTGKIYGLAFSPDGTRLATSSTDGMLIMWDPVTGQRITSEPSAEKRYAVAISADNRWLAVAGERGSVTLWNPASGERRALRGHAATVQYLTFSPDGTRLATTGQDLAVWIWNIETGEGKRIAQTQEDFVRVAFSHDSRLLALSEDIKPQIIDLQTGAAVPLPAGVDAYQLALSMDGQWIAGGGENGNVYLWKRGSTDVRVLAGVGPVIVMAFSPDGQRLAVGDKKDVRLWDVSSGRGRILSGHDNVVTSLLFSPDGQLLASGGRDSQVRLWRLDSGASQVLRGHDGWVSGLLFSPDGSLLVTASQDGTARIWPVQDSARSFVASEGHIQHLMFSPDGRFLVSGGSEGDIALWERNNGQRRYLSGHSGAVLQIVMSSDGERIATTSDDRAVRLWSLSTGQSELVGQHGTDQGTLAMSPDGNTLAWMFERGIIRVWERATGETRDAPVTSMDEAKVPRFSPDGTLLAYSRGADLVVWNRRSGAVQVLAGHSGPVLALAFAPDGASIASGGGDREVRLWSLASGDSRVLARHTDEVRGLRFSPDGALLVSAGYRGDIWLTHLASSETRELVGHYRGIEQVAFSPDSRMLASASGDATLRVWDVVTGEGRVWSAEYSGPPVVAFSPDGRHLAATGGGGVMVWPFDAPTDPQALRAWMQELTSERIGSKPH